MFDHSIRTLEESIRFFAGLGFEEGVEAKDMAHAVAVLKAAGEITFGEKRDLWGIFDQVAKNSFYPSTQKATRKLLAILEALPEKP